VMYGYTLASLALLLTVIILKYVFRRNNDMFIKMIRKCFIIATCDINGRIIMSYDASLHLDTFVSTFSNLEFKNSIQSYGFWRGEVEYGSKQFLNATIMKDSAMSYSIIAFDVTESHRKALEYKYVHDLSKDTELLSGVSTWDWDITNNNIYWSDKLHTIYGLQTKPENISYQQIIEYTDPAMRELFQQSVEKAKQDPSYEYDIDCKIVMPDKSLKWVRSRGGVKRGENGDPVNMIGVVFDVSKEKNYEEQVLLAKHHAEEANKAKSQLLANVSHETRTPLNIVIGILQLLEQDSDLSEQNREHVLQAKYAAENLLELLNDIIDLSKAEAQKIQLEIIQVDVVQLIHGIVESLARSAHEKGLEIEYFIDGSVPTMIMTDPTRVRQILFNLLGNAVKFTEKGSVTLRVSVVNQFSDDKVQLRFDVIDTGIGISDEQFSDIFNSFTQADNSITRRFGGSGLGLTISKQLALLMNGDITVTSSVNNGSIFSATIQVQKCNDDVMLKHKSFLDGIRILAIIGDKNPVLNTKLQHIAAVDKILCYHHVLTPQCAVDLLQRNAKEPYNLILITDDLSREECEVIKNTYEDLNLPNPFYLMKVLPYSKRIKMKDNEVVNYIATTPLHYSIFHDCIIGQRVLTRRKKSVPTVAFATQIKYSDYRILVVDDNILNQRILVRMLNKIGITCIDVANDGNHVLEKLQMKEGKPYDMIFMDVQMPCMDGYTCTSLIREQESRVHKILHTSCPKIPIVALTANVMEGDRKLCIQAGMDHYIPKVSV
jgi:signal transduction histidine kinase/CheY-like chemotaxis protein